MRILGRCHQIGPAVNDVGPSAGRIEGLKRLFAQHYFDPRGFSRLEFLRLDIARELYGGDFHSILLRILRIGLLDIKLYDLLARPVSGIKNVHRDLIAFLPLLHRHVLQLEVCVGQAVSEGIRNFPVIVEGTPGGGPQNSVFIAGLIISVPDIDSLGVHQIPVAELHIAVPDPVISKICCRRRVQAVIYKGIRKSAGRVDASAEHFRHGCHPVYTERACPEARVDPVLLHKSHFHRIYSVEHYDHLIKALRHIGEQFSLFLRQLKGFRSGHHGLTALFRFRIGRLIQICQAGFAADHDNCGLGVLLHTLLHAPREGISSTSLREIPQFFIDPDLLRFQSVLQSHGRSRCALVVVYRIDRAFPENADHCPLAERKHVVIVAQQNDPLSLDPFRQLCAVSSQFRCILVLCFKILRAFLPCRLIVALPKRKADCLLVIRSDFKPGENCGEQHSCQHDSCYAVSAITPDPAPHPAKALLSFCGRPSPGVPLYSVRS